MIKHGIIGGIVAGIVFALFQMVMGFFVGGIEGFFMPLRMIGALLLGEQALAQTYPLLRVVTVGIVIHMIVSAMLGVVFTWILSTFAPIRSKGALVGAATIYGLLTWIVNFYVIAPLIGWTWFPILTNPLQQTIAHTFFYGTALGIYLNSIVTVEKRRHTIAFR